MKREQIYKLEENEDKKQLTLVDQASLKYRYLS